MSGRRLPGLVVVGLIVVAAVLLVAGFGFAVGAGIIVGVLLGLAGVIAAVVLARSGSSMGWSTSAMSEMHDAELFQDYGRTLARVADVDAGALTRVVPVAEEAVAGGVRIELVAVELRTDGGIATLVTHTRPPIGMIGHFADGSVTDDVGTAYVAAAQGSGQSSPSTARFELRFSPAPPSQARLLTVEVRSFRDPFPGTPSTPVEGPWSFSVPLTSSDH